MTGNKPPAASSKMQPFDKKERGVRFWRRCAAEPHCIRLLPENQPRTRNEAMLRRVVRPGDPRSYFDHMGRFMYPTHPVAMDMDAIRERRRQGLEVVRRHTELLKSIVLKEKPKPSLEDMNIAAMRNRLEQARRESAQHMSQRRPHQTPALPAVKGGTGTSCNTGMGK